MPDDRFGDLGAPAEEDPPPERSGQTAAERFAELDEREPERKPKRPEPVRPSGRYTWVVGVAALIVIVLAGIRAASHSGGENVKGPAVGSIIAPFAAPSATGNLNGDANVKQRAGDGDSAGKRPACALPESVDVVNICDLRRSALVLTFITTRGAKCAPELDRVQHVADRHPEMQFAAVVSGNERKDVGKLVRQHGWRFPVAVDHDGAVVNLYAIGICPVTIFSSPGGRVREVKLGNLKEAELDAAVRRLEAVR